MISRACRPIDPVAPRRAIRFIPLEVYEPKGLVGSAVDRFRSPADCPVANHGRVVGIFTGAAGAGLLKAKPVPEFVHDTAASCCCYRTRRRIV